MALPLFTRPSGRRNRPEFVDIDGLAAFVEDGYRIAMGGFHFSRLPIALCQAVARRGVKDLHYICWGGSLGLEILLEGGCIGRLGICFNSLDVFGLSPRFRSAVESGQIPMEDLTDTVLMEGQRAAQYGMDSMSFVLPLGSQLLERTSVGTVHPDPLTGRPMGVAEPIPLDALLLHAQRADEDGNVEIQGARNLDLTAGFASRDILVTVEEIVPAGTFQNPTAPRGQALAQLDGLHPGAEGACEQPFHRALEAPLEVPQDPHRPSPQALLCLDCAPARGSVPTLAGDQRVPGLRWSRPCYNPRSIPLGEWRNWQTRRIQVPVSARTWGFKSPFAHTPPRRMYGSGGRS